MGAEVKKTVVSDFHKDELKPKYVVVDGDSTDINEGVEYYNNHHGVDDGYMFYYYLEKSEDDKKLWKAEYSHTTTWRKRDGFRSEEKVFFTNHKDGTRHSFAFYEKDSLVMKTYGSEGLCITGISYPSMCDIEKLYHDKLSQFCDSINYVDWEFLIHEHRPKTYRIEQ